MTLSIYHPTGATAQAFTRAGAKAIVERASPEILSKTADSKYILHTLPGISDTTENFAMATISIVDSNGAIAAGMVSLFELEEAITKWARKSTVVGARGDRIAIVSNCDKLYSDNTTQTNVYIWEVALSTMLVYNHRRAIAFFPRTQDEADADMNNLRSFVKQLDVGFRVNFAGE